MNERTQALLQYHFDHGPRPLFRPVSASETPDVVIVDYDYPDTRAQLESGQWQTARSLMLLAYSEPPVDNVIVVRKPLDRARLDAAARELLKATPPKPVGRLRTTNSPTPAGSAGNTDQSKAEKAAPTATPMASPTIAPMAGAHPASPPAAATGTERPATAPAELLHDAAPGAGSGRTVSAAVDSARHHAKISRLCGEPRELSDLELPDDETHRYDPQDYFLFRLRATLAARQPDVQLIQLHLSGIDFYVMPTLSRIYLTASLQQAANVERIFGPLGSEPIEQTSYQRADIPRLLQQMDGRARYTFTLDAFAWLGSLFTARGRLPRGTDIHQPCRLHRWPNFTRLELTPECLTIAAAWSAAKRSIAETIEAVGCEPRYVTSFYNGAIALGTLECCSDPTLSESGSRA